MKLVFDPEKLRYALSLRGMNLRDLAEAAGCSTTTATSALRGRPLTIATALRMRAALASRPPIPGMEELVALPSGQPSQPLEPPVSSAA